MVLFHLLFLPFDLADSRSGLKELCQISAGEFKEMDIGGDEIVIDVRTAREYNNGHIRGAILIDIYQKDFADRIKSLDRNQKYIVYCKTGIRSYRASQFMLQQGFQDICNLKGGILQIQRAGVPLVK